MNNQKKQSYSSIKEQQKFCNKYKWLNIVNVKLTNMQLKKLKTAVKNKTRTSLRMSLKILAGDNLPHKLLLTTRQKTKEKHLIICQLI